MTIPVTALPSGGFGYSFPSINIEPMNFLLITQYLLGAPKDDPLELYLYDITNLLKDDRTIEDCYIMDVDFLIFFKKLITIGDGNSFTLSIKCPVCGLRISKEIVMDEDIKFKLVDPNIMNGATINLNGHQYNTIVPTVKDFFKIFDRYLKYRTVTDLDMIKTIALISDAELNGNQVLLDVLEAKHEDITLLMALREIYYNLTESMMFHCPHCEKDQKLEERRGIAVSVESLTVDFFRELYINSPIDESKIVFKQVFES